MSYHEYVTSRRLDAQDLPFYALIMAAMRKCDAENGAKLRAAWPTVWLELVERYNAPGGILPDEITST